MRCVVAACCLLIGGVDVAYAFCIEPSFFNSAPQAPSSFSKPDVPYCLSSSKFSGSPQCSQWEIDAYRQEIEDYVGKLDSYIDDTATFARSAVSHLREVEGYAKCAAEEVSTQHQ